MDCHDWKTSLWEVNENLVKNKRCHICGHAFVVNTVILWHAEPIFEGCHKECGMEFHQSEGKEVGKFEPEPEPLAIRLQRRRERKRIETFRPIIEDSATGTSDNDE